MAGHTSPRTDNCRGLRFLPASPIPSQISTACVRYTPLRRTSGQSAAMEKVSIRAAVLIRWRRTCRCRAYRRCWGGGIRWSRFAKARIIDPRVDLDFFGGKTLLDIRSRAALVDPKWVFQALDLVEVREEGFPGKILVSVFANAFPLQKQKRRGIKKVKADISILVRQLQPVDRFVVQAFFAHQLDLVALGLVVHQRAVKVRFIGNVLELFGRQRLNIFGLCERIDHPAGRLAVVNADNLLTSNGDLHVHLQGTLELHYKCAFHALRERDAATDALRLDGFNLFDSAASVECFLDDFVGGLSSRGQRQEQE